MTTGAERHAAREVYNRAVNRGELVRAGSCEYCGASGCRIDGHHTDYTKPLDVVWLCRKCHVAEHSNSRNRKVPTMLNEDEYRDLITRATELMVAENQNISMGEVMRRALRYYLKNVEAPDGK